MEEETCQSDISPTPTYPHLSMWPINLATSRGAKYSSMVNRRINAKHVLHNLWEKDLINLIIVYTRPGNNPHLSMWPVTLATFGGA